MRIHRPHLSRRDAERLLDDPATHGSALGSLLAAAGAPGRPGELGGEAAAVSAFRQAATAPADGRALVPAPRRSGRTAVRAVVATGAVVALTSGGFALAGSADLPRIPGLPGQAADRATEAVATTSEPSGTTTTTATPADDETTETGAPGASGSRTPGSATPSPNLEGLCHAFQASDRTHGASLDSAAFTALVTAAGGAQQVADYCVDLIGEPRPTGKPSVLPTPTSTPSPTNRPTAKPTPTSKPTAKPTPTKKPTAKPTPTAKPSPTDKGGGRNS